MVAIPLAHISWAIADNADRKACDRFFIDTFGAEIAYEMLVTPENVAMGLDREESLMMIGDTMIIPIAPAAHYHMGGVLVDAAGRTSLPGLWACGEVAYTGLHGANRLASNSLLEAVVCGRSVGETLAAAPIEDRMPPAAAFTSEKVEGLLADPADCPSWPLLRDRVWRALGPVRDGTSMRRAIAATRADRGALPTRSLLLRRRLDLVLAMLEAALERCESRGAHWRGDYPRRDASRDGPSAVHRRQSAVSRTPGGASGGFGG